MSVFLFCFVSFLTVSIVITLQSTKDIIIKKHQNAGLRGETENPQSLVASCFHAWLLCLVHGQKEEFLGGGFLGWFWCWVLVYFFFSL